MQIFRFTTVRDDALRGEKKIILTVSLYRSSPANGTRVNNGFKGRQAQAESKENGKGL